jgi:hypothetical protein
MGSLQLKPARGCTSNNKTCASRDALEKKVGDDVGIMDV